MITTLLIVLLVVVVAGIASKYLSNDARNILWLVVITVLVFYLLGQL